MSDEHELSTHAVVAAAHTFLTDNLRQHLPFMDIQLVNKAAENAVSSLKSDVAAAKPQIEASKARSSFFSLPPELRNHIYELALNSDNYTGYCIQLEDGSDGLSGRATCGRLHTGDYIDYWFPFPSLLHTSQQVRAETLSIFLSGLSIFVSSDLSLANGQHPQADRAREWLAALGPELLKTVGKVVLRVQTSTPETVGLNPHQAWERFGFGGLGLREEAMTVKDPGLAYEWCVERKQEQ